LALEVETRASNPCPSYENKCATLDRQIDNLVYELYDLSPDEIALAPPSS